MRYPTSVMPLLAVAIIILMPLASQAEPGCFTVGDDLTIENGGTLAIEVGGSTKCTQFDSVDVLGNTQFDNGSIIDVTLINSYSPVGTFEILTSTGPITNNGIALHPSDTGVFTLTVNSNNVVLNTIGSPPNTDPDINGIVNGRDFLDIQVNNPSVIPDWRTDYGGPPTVASASAGLGAGLSAVPEPSSVVLLLGMLAMISCRRRLPNGR